MVLDEHFLDFFAGHGYRALALSLRGHGTSPTAKRLKTCSIVDYVDDLRSVAAGLPVAPVVVGHLMGGFVVQKSEDAWRRVFAFFGEHLGAGATT